jgi:serine/threonine-protein kinase
MALEAGSRLGPYEIVGRLGSGGMGEVYRARDPRLDREVAIKVLPENVADRKHLRRFEQEARAAGALNHPSVLAVHDVGSHEGAPYVVSELLEGHTLRARLEGGALPVRKTLDLALQIARGLAAAHDKGIVHRDLKPDNVFITEDGRVKILDFGLAKLTRPEPLFPEGRQGKAAEGTASGAVVGTAGYMSPEQVRGEAVDHRSDIFSFGAVLYEMLSGGRAFRRDSAVETMNAILKEDPPEILEARGISPAVAGLVRRCLEKRAPDRFHSAHDLALALEAVSSGLSGPSVEHGALGVVRPVRVLKRYKRWVALGAMVLVAAGLYWGLVRSPPRTAVGVVDSVAVLPFDNVGGDPDREYLSDGIADTLVNELSRLPNVRVIARSTSFRFRGSEVDPQEVGRDLGVGAVLTGRVSQQGETLVIGAELVDVAQGTRLWGERYNTKMRDIFAVQEGIARDISRGLRLKLARDETSLTRRHTPSPEAYRLYLLSRYEQTRPLPRQGAKRALEYAQQATEKDPAFAAAYAALAMANIRLGIGGVLPAGEVYSKARTAATRALELDETVAEAHEALALVVLHLDRDWAGAESAFKRAIELNPNSPPAHRGYGLYLYQAGRPQEGMEQIKRALELDPLSPESHLFLSFGYHFDRRFDQALEAARTASDMDPVFKPDFYLAVNYREKGMFEEAIAEFRKSPGQSAPGLAHLGNTYARAGRVTEARDCLRKLNEMFRRDNVGTYGMALIHAGLGEKDQAFAWLEKAYEARDQGMMYLKIDAALDPLRSDPRFEGLLRRMNFPS